MGTRDAYVVLRKVYSLYTDYDMKDPFYVIEMPIKVAQFEQRVSHLIRDRQGMDMI